jgi:hypothetical protein
MAAVIRLNYCGSWPDRIDIGILFWPPTNRIPGARPAAAPAGSVICPCRCVCCSGSTGNRALALDACSGVRLFRKCPVPVTPARQCVISGPNWKNRDGAKAHYEPRQEDLQPRERVPLQWASVQDNLERESGTARLEEAVAAYREALKELPASAYRSIGL